MVWWAKSTVDPTPLSVVRTTNPRHAPSTRLLFIHDNCSVDAEVMEWGQGQGKDGEVFDIREGSRHRMMVQGSTITGWVTVNKKNDKGEAVENLKPVEKKQEGENIDAEKEQLVVCAAKPLIVRSGFSQDTEKIGTLNARIVVHVLETRFLEDGSQRSMVSSLAGESVLITAALNEFNHSVQRFANVASYEMARLNYLEDIVGREHGGGCHHRNMLRIGTRRYMYLPQRMSSITSVPAGGASTMWGSRPCYSCQPEG